MKEVRQTLGLIFCAFIVGTALGLLFPAFGSKLIPISATIIQLLKAAATPLVFFAILEAVVRFRVEGRDFLKLFAITSINAVIAVSIGLLVANIFKPGKYLGFLATGANFAKQEISFVDSIKNQIPSSIIDPFLHNNIMALVVVTLACGFAWRQAKAKHQEQFPAVDNLEAAISFFRTISETVLLWLVKLLPLAVLASSAALSATRGLKPFEGLGLYAALCLLAMGTHLLVVFSLWLIFYVRMNVFYFWRHALRPAIWSFSVNSSLVTLPLTLKTLDNLGVSRRASTLAACIGTNLNNDGIILYEGFTLLVVAQAIGYDMSIGSQILAAIYCIVAAAGVVGVPEAGIVALTLVMSSVGLPAESLAILLSVDWLLARSRSFLNTTTDMTSALILDKWLKCKQEKEHIP